VARALLAGAYNTQQRAGELLEMSRRTLGRADETDLFAPLQNPAVVTEARTVLANTARRGSYPGGTEGGRDLAAEALCADSPRPPSGAGQPVPVPPSLPDAQLAARTSAAAQPASDATD
jgi:hypothetical protein